MPVEHFASKGAEMRNLAYRHEHGIAYTAREACIGTGKSERCHKVKHSTNKKREAIDSKQKEKVAKRGKSRKPAR